MTPSSASRAAGALRLVWSHPANRRRHLRALLQAVVWQVHKRVTGRPLDLALPGALRLRCYPDSTSGSRMVYCAGLPDYHEMTFMRRYLRAGDGFIDAGANVGAYTLFAAALVGRQAPIESFEPEPREVERLRENVALNGLRNVRVHQVALGAEPGRVRLTVGGDTINRVELDSLSTGARTIEVDCVRLDDVLQGRRYAMGKMDIEGAEPLALRGAERMLREANPPVWLLEMNGALRWYGFTEEGLRDWLAERGYDLALYDADRRSFTRQHRPWESRDDVLAIARAHWDGVQARVVSTLD